MVSYQKQITQVKDKFLKKISIIFCIIIISVSDIVTAKNLELKLLNYNEDLKNSSLLFIQSDGRTVEEGVVYISFDRIRVDYTKPNKNTIVLSKKKGMYVNHELKEAQYFDTNKSFVNIFFKILTGEIFYEDSDITISNDNIVIKSNFESKENYFKIEVIYENEPVKLRKIKVIENQDSYEFGFFNQQSFDHKEKDFSLINPYLF